MNNLPLEFFSEARAEQNFEQPWMISSGEMKSSCAIPAEFGGSGGGFSPEDLFLQAAINCFIGTFKVVAKLSKLNYSEVHVKGKLDVNKNDDGKIVMKSISLVIKISDVDRPERLESIVAKVMRDGFILNSVKSELSYKLIQDV
jgi:organic hydroperoxide reductase OsmC/OhrA